MFFIFLFQISYFTIIQSKLMLCPGPIKNLCFLLTFINILRYFNVTCLPLFTPISLTNSILIFLNISLLFKEIQSLDNKIHETVETINTMKIQREFFLSFAKEPQLFISKWIISQSRGKKLQYSNLLKTR